MTEGPIQSFTSRSSGQLPGGRTQRVPWNLSDQLRDWLSAFLTDELERRVANRMSLSLGRRSQLGEALEFGGYGPSSGNLISQLRDNARLLDAVDYALQLDREVATELWNVRELPEWTPDRSARWRLVATLTDLFDDTGSTLDVRAPEDRFLLVDRVDPTTQAAVDSAVAGDDSNASTLLARAWAKAYGREPDSDGAYYDAVRAVEALACPLVLPTSTRRTLNAVALHLRDDSQRSDPSRRKWELVLTKFGDGTVEPLVAMFDRLWHGNLASRHGDDEHTYREVDLVEARAGVQLAVLCVQWLTDGLLRPRTPGTP